MNTVDKLIDLLNVKYKYKSFELVLGNLCLNIIFSPKIEKFELLSFCNKNSACRTFYINPESKIAQGKDLKEALLELIDTDQIDEDVFYIYNKSLIEDI